MIVPLLGLALIAGCDRQKPAAPQGADVDAAAAGSSAGAEATPSPLEKDTLGRVDITHRGQSAPAVPFEGPDGGPATLATWRGKPLIVNLWATWCAPCLAEMPALDRLAQREAARLTLVTVSQDMAGKRAVGPYFEKNRFEALTANLDKTGELLRAVKSDSLPLTIFYDAKGREQWRVTGSTDWEGAKAAKLIETSLAGA
ncbi:MAG: TlpA disulfide reductase family protein [Sphingomonas sp.]